MQHEQVRCKKELRQRYCNDWHCNLGPSGGYVKCFFLLFLGSSLTCCCPPHIHLRNREICLARVCTCTVVLFISHCNFYLAKHMTICSPHCYLDEIYCGWMPRIHSTLSHRNTHILLTYFQANNINNKPILLLYHTISRIPYSFNVLVFLSEPGSDHFCS